MGLFDWLFVARNGPKPKADRRPTATADRDPTADSAPPSSAERRRVPRVQGLGARVIIDAVEYDVLDWAENSFRIAGYDGSLIERQIVHFRFLLVYREETWEWPGIGRVVRRDGERRELAVIFQAPEEPFRTRLAQVIDVLSQQEGAQNR
ncbi:MAG: hypothetical protein NXI21_07145 [Alphaproteobacteria bacterium]|nr:hypothetical protein [Alphaproteobacteria bacterium]